jgi:O-antigen/teichoic acid export membrane protein
MPGEVTSTLAGTIRSAGHPDGEIPAARAPQSPTLDGAATRVVRNSTLNLATQGLYSGFNLLLVYVLAGLGTERFGRFYLFFALILIVQIFWELGATTILTRRIVQTPDRWREMLPDAAGLFTLIALCSLGTFLCFGGAWAWWQADAELLVCSAAAGVACAAIQVQRFSGAIFQAFELFRYENLGKLLQILFLTSVAAALVRLNLASITGLVWLLAASHVAAALYMTVALQRRWRCLAWRLHLSRIKEWFAESVPLALGDMARGLSAQLDTALVGLLQPAAAVGIYSMAYRPLGPVYWLPRVVMQAAFPSFARLASADHQALGRAFSSSLRLMWLISLPMALCVSAYAGPVVAILAGPEFAAAAVPMRILAWIVSLSFLSFQFRFVLTALGRAQAYVRLAVPVLLLEVCLELALIPRWGYLGACAGLCAGELTFALGGLALCLRAGLGTIEWRPLAGGALGAVVMGAVLWGAGGRGLLLLSAAAVVGLALYAGVCLWSRALRWTEVRRLGESLAGLM